MKSSDHYAVYNIFPLYKLIYLSFAFFYLLSGCQDFLVTLSNNNTWFYFIGCLHCHSVIISRSINFVSFAPLSKKKRKKEKKKLYGRDLCNILFYIDLYEQGKIGYKEFKNDYSFRRTLSLHTSIINIYSVLFI